MVIEQLFIVFDNEGFSRLHPGDSVLALGKAARLPKPVGLIVYADKKDQTSDYQDDTILLDTKSLIKLLFSAKHLIHL